MITKSSSNDLVKIDPKTSPIQLLDSARAVSRAVGEQANNDDLWYMEPCRVRDQISYWVAKAEANGLRRVQTGTPKLGERGIEYTEAKLFIDGLVAVLASSASIKSGGRFPALMEFHIDWRAVCGQKVPNAGQEKHGEKTDQLHSVQLHLFTLPKRAPNKQRWMRTRLWPFCGRYPV